MKILIIGTGAIGGLYGWFLQKAGCDVSVVCRSDYEIVKTQGIAIDSYMGSGHFTPHYVINRTADYPDKADVLLLATKALPDMNWHTLLSPVVHPAVTLMLIQNGIFVEAPIQAACPSLPLISGISFVCATRTRPGHIVHSASGSLVLGMWPEEKNPVLDTLAALFEQQAIPCKITSNILRARFRKLMWNAAFNTISVLSGGRDTLQMLTDPPTRALIRSTMLDVIKIARACGQTINENEIEIKIADTELEPPYKPSMLIDHEQHRPMEVEAILGKARELARQHQIDVPYIDTLYALLNQVNSGRTHP